MPQSLSKIYIHLIFSTKDRYPFLEDEEIRNQLHASLATVLSNLKCPTILINSMPDHIHLLFRLHRTITVAKTVEDIKKGSSKWLKSKSPGLAKFAWQTGYGAFSVSESNAPSVANYIRNQTEHHRTKSFQEEYREFLSKHQIEYDEQYLWD